MGTPMTQRPAVAADRAERLAVCTLLNVDSRHGDMCRMNMMRLNFKQGSLLPGRSTRQYALDRPTSEFSERALAINQARSTSGVGSSDTRSPKKMSRPKRLTQRAALQKNLP